jgi:hypothetical protein
LPLEPVSRLLNRSTELAGFRERLARVARLQARYRRCVPDALAASSRVGAIDGRTVVIQAENGSVAAAIKAIAPRVVVALNRGGDSPTEPKTENNQEVTALRVEVQVVALPPRPSRLAATAPSAETLARIADGLSDSPLRQVLRRMAAAQSSRKTRSTR